MVIRLRRLPMPLRVLCVLLAVLLLAGTVFAPVAHAEALTATIALFGGAALVSGVLAAAGLKASDSAAWNGWCSKIAASDSVRSAAQALTSITLPAGKLVAMVYAAKTYVSKALQLAIINEAISSGAYDTSSIIVDSSSVGSVPGNSYSGASIAWHVGLVPSWLVSYGNLYNVNVVSSAAPIYYFLCDSNDNSSFSFFWVSSGPFRLNAYYDRNHYMDASSTTYLGITYYVYSTAWGGTYSYSQALAPTVLYGHTDRGFSVDASRYLCYMLMSSVITAGGIDGVTQQDGAISDPIGKDVIGSLDDLKTKVTDWSDYLDTGVDVAIDGAAEGVASEAVPSLPVTIPTTGQQGAQTYPDARTGTTDSTIIDTGTSTASVAQNQGVVSKLLSDVLDYLKPDTGFWDKFPLCIPYDMYLFVASLSGKDMSDSSIFSASPGNLPSAVAADVQPQNDWQPIINIDQDWDVSGVHIPWHITLDLTPFLPLFEIIRLFVGASFIFGLYWYEWHRIKEDS